MGNDNIKRLADRLAGWYDNFAPYEPPEQSDYFFIQLDNRDNREPLLDLLKETATEMDKTIDHITIVETDRLIETIKVSLIMAEDL